MLTASSMFPMKALTVALPQSSKMSGDSYMVLANLMRTCSGVATENSLYPWVARRLGMSVRRRPEVREVRKCATVSWTLCYAAIEMNMQTHLD